MITEAIMSHRNQNSSDKKEIVADLYEGDAHNGLTQRASLSRRQA